ncbi:Ubiquitin-like protein [Purpureocillium takamizusanense]|uniref:Ubiquitin-like protein ATG12 n=1 Tax=Purpureocillium takamizusanense TaxID=2060973 RepID=A0A9Q8QEL3_9HYPO|nr:Ubiquitin-like protein [Purpureocillium takamizusanense]UNI18205.1 Ubiquitin-like protein [Purpureocillium takamizusanense]
MEPPHHRASSSTSPSPAAAVAPASPVPETNPDPDSDSDSAAAAAAAEEEQQLPLTMSASVVLADLPRDATAALASAAAPAPDRKVVVRFKPVGGAAPALQQDLCKITATRRFEEVVRYLRRKLRCRDTDSVFLYVNSAFAPSLDEVVGNLHQCFKNASDQLVVAYSMTPAFG